jgi:hypothetical protein
VIQYRGVQMLTGALTSDTIDSLSTFWPGLQVCGIFGAVTPSPAVSF